MPGANALEAVSARRGDTRAPQDRDPFHYYKTTRRLPRHPLMEEERETIKTPSSR